MIAHCFQQIFNVLTFSFAIRKQTSADISIILVIKLKISVLTHHIRRQQISCDRLDTLCSIAYSNSDFKITKEVGGSHASLIKLKSTSRSRVRKHRNISVKRDKITHIQDCRMQKQGIYFQSSTRSKQLSSPETLNANRVARVTYMCTKRIKGYFHCW